MYGLIGKLYHNVIKGSNFLYLKNQYDPSCENGVEYFQIHWLKIKKPTTRYWGSLVKHDVFEASYREDVSSWINNEQFEETIHSELAKLNLDKDKVLSNLVNALDSTDIFYDHRVTIKDDPDYRCYDEKAKNRLINYFNKTKELPDKEHLELEHCIYLYVYFALMNTVPTNLSETARTKKDLEDFTERVIKQYGATSKHAIREIVRLATQPNPNRTALFLYADLLYFGNAKGIEQNIELAFSMYKQAAGIDSANENIKKISEANPLALWSISYIYYDYENPAVKESLSDKCTIQEVKSLSFRDRIWRSIRRAKEAESIADLPCIANTLGLLARLIDEDLDDPELRELRKEFDLKKCTDYFESAAKGGFVYAYNNLAEEERRAFIKEKGHPKQQKEHLINYMKYLDESARRSEPWAANKLGRIYLEGIKIIDSKADESRFNTLVNRKSAFNYFFKAYEAYHVFYDENCAWACGHLIREFINELTEEQIDDMYDIIESYSHKKEIVVNAFNQDEMPSKEQVLGHKVKSL